MSELKYDKHKTQRTTTNNTTTQQGTTTTPGVVAVYLLYSLSFSLTNKVTMASRDLTSAFIERRSAANLRRRTGENVGGGSRMKPFGKNTSTTSIISVQY